MLSVAYTLQRDRAELLDHLLLSRGAEPRMVENLEESLAPVRELDEDTPPNVVQIAEWVENVNRGLM